MTDVANVPVKKDKHTAPEMRRERPPLDHLRQEVDRLFDEFGRGFFPFPSRWAMPSADPFWRNLGRDMEPAADVLEKPDSFQITAELPGIDEKNIEVNLSNGILSIKGEKREEKEQKDASYYMSERRYGSFERAFRLPEGIDPDKIEAHFKNGVLTVTLPKTEASKKAKQIAIKAA